MSTSISPSLSMASKKWHTWSRTSPPFSMRCSISCFNSVAFWAGPLNWYMLSSFSQTSLEVSHLLICFSSLGLMESIIRLGLTVVDFPLFRGACRGCVSGHMCRLCEKAAHVRPRVILDQHRLHLQLPRVVIVLAERFDAR